MGDRIRFYYNRIREHLWVKPLVICILSVAAAFVAKLADQIEFLSVVPEVTLNSLNVFLSISSGSMLGVATFAVGSMLTAYGSASNTATPRSFPLIIADDVSQSALSSFIGAFIFSIVALVALENGYYGPAGRFLIFLLTVFVFAVIIFNFIRWLDRIARLGRLGNTVDKVEKVACESLIRRRKRSTYGAKEAVGSPEGEPIYAEKVGYIQRIDLPILQRIAETSDVHITVASLPGKFTFPDQPVAYVAGQIDPDKKDGKINQILDTFIIDDDRAFDEDPRFGLVVLSEIASRALSPAVNDPGTAIDVIGSLVRIFTAWVRVDEKNIETDVEFDRVSVPKPSIEDMFDDAFTGISRDGAGTIEVVVHQMKALRSLACLGDVDMQKEATVHAERTLNYAQKSLSLREEIAQVEALYHSISKL